MDARQDATAPADIVGAVLRQQSKSGCLLSEQELRRKLVEHSQAPSVDLNRDFESVLEEALQRHDDLQELTADDGTRFYYSSQDMSRTYALMLVQMQGDPARLVAGVVRENSASYPRPVSLDIFMRPPFSLTHEKVLACLDRMGRDAEYEDIASITTSASTLYLYSTLHLEPDHASMLAEWIDVGQFENP
jgi:hypothetical protein